MIGAAEAMVPPGTPAGAQVWAGLDPHDPLHVVHQGYTVLVSHHDGSITGGGRAGLWDYDTRIVSHWRAILAGERPVAVISGARMPARWAAHLRVLRAGGTASGPRLPQDALELIVVRRVGRGLEERLVVHNHGMTAADAELAVEIDADFRDIQEAYVVRVADESFAATGRDSGARADRPEPEPADPSWRPRIERHWDAAARELHIDARAARDGHVLHRALRVRIVASDSEPSSPPDAGPPDAGPPGEPAAAPGPVVLRFPLHLPPRGEWRATLIYASLVDGEWREPPPESPLGGSERDRARERWRARRTRIAASHAVAGAAVEQAAEDLFSLRAWEYDEAPDAWFPIAGVPTYTGIFGRDLLTASWQGALLGPEMLRGALAIIAKTQATSDSAFHDREPGKLVHEIRRGPLSELGIVPQRGYYGTQTTPAMFLLALSEYWHWTGDDAALRRYRDTALRALAWAERYGDRDGDGFLEYVRRSPRGLKNHAWKDSDEAIRHPDGTLVDNPIATVEEQAYYCIALERMAEILTALGDDGRAEVFLNRARRLRRRWDEAFWVEEDRFYAMALDAAKRPVRSIGSNAGHALGAGIVPRAKARAVADRLMADDLFNGWGIRTLSTAHPSYNPFGYHLGTVWPVENATFALGFKRYGLDAHVDRLATGLFAAASHFERLRLPESLGGHGSGESPFPTVYPGSNSPQAWSAGATVQLLQVLLGIYPFAPARLLLLVRPRLPAWLGEVTIRGLRVGDASVSLRFRRERDGTASHSVIERRGRLHVVRAPPPDAVDPTGLAATAQAWALDHAPGRLARALRLAIGRLDG